MSDFNFVMQLMTLPVNRRRLFVCQSRESEGINFKTEISARKIVNLNRGFTLIELMIVVAIIGILASLALPMFMNSVAKSQAVEALKVISGVQASVVEQYTTNGNLAIIDPTTISLAASLAGKYISVNTITVNNLGEITVPFSSGRLAGQTMVVYPEFNAGAQQVQGWKCRGISPATWMPRSCL